MTKQQEKFFEENMNLVYYTISRYYPTHIGDEDIIQEGMLGLFRAVNDFDPEKGAFSTFAIYKIRGAIANEFKKVSRRVPTVSLDGMRGSDSDDGECTLDQFIVGSPDEGYTDWTPLMKKLTDQEKVVLKGLIEGNTQADMARAMGVSRQRVEQIMRKIKKKWIAVMET